MANDLTTTDQADGHLAQARRALSLLPSTTDALVANLGHDAPACLAAGLAKLEHDLRPVPAAGADRRQWEMALDERLRKLAVKVSPTASPAQTGVWRETMIEALSDLPAMVSLTAAKRALHRPLRYMGDIEHEVRLIAAEVMADRRWRLDAVRRMIAELERARNAPPSISCASADIDPAAITATIATVCDPDLRATLQRIAVTSGFIDADQEISRAA